MYVTEAEVERAQLHLVDARNAKANAKVALDNALGLSDTAPDFRPADVLKYSPVNETLPPLIGKAFQTRPDLKMLESEAHAMGATVAEFRSDYLPTVNAVAGYEGAGTGLPVVNNFNAGIVITWPIFNSFLTTDQIAEAKFRQQDSGTLWRICVEDNSSSEYSLSELAGFSATHRTRPKGTVGIAEC